MLMRKAGAFESLSCASFVTELLNPPLPFAGEGLGEGVAPNLLFAQATAKLPTSSGLAEKIEVQFTLYIKAKAQELNYQPVKIYEWVRNNIEFVPELRWEKWTPKLM